MNRIGGFKPPMRFIALVKRHSGRAFPNSVKNSISGHSVCFAMVCGDTSLRF
jgi:hypothetical protein